MPHQKTKKIEAVYRRPRKDMLILMYLKNKLSSPEIVKKIENDAQVTITPRWVQLSLKNFGLSRTKSAARFIAIQNGRIDYDKLRKPIKSKESRKGISLALRYAVLKRDKSQCVLCGSNASEARLVIDHIIPRCKRGHK